MMKFVPILFIIIIFPGCLSVCRRVSFELITKKNSSDLCKKVRPYRSTASVYDQGKTVVLCDILWLSPSIRFLYEQQKSPGLDEQCKYVHCVHNTDMIFYVLLAPADRDRELSMYSPCAYWSIILQKDGIRYAPSTIERVCLPTAYRRMFGLETTRFRDVYCVIFKTDQEHDISNHTPDVQLQLISADYTVVLPFEATA